MKQRALALIALLWCIGCEEKKEAPAPEAPAPVAEATKPAEPPPKSADELAAEAAAEKAKAEQGKEQAAVDENPLTGCCRSLGQKGFMERSPEYMAASQVCGEALTSKKELSSVLPDIKKALKSQPLPDTCGP